ncbi:MAG TPA: hypothetical protein VMF67_01385 [Rhizomicrobium sp.]|nr:hypothetical protein [Rhizomicrobium sp.]
MSGAAKRGAEFLGPEEVAYWYFRLNGFFQIENFVIHPKRHGGQRTDADLLAIRFPFRAERMFDDPNDIMTDDERSLGLSSRLIDVVIAEVKTNQPCTLNGPWTRKDRQNVHRVLAAIGCLPPEHIERAAADIYQTGVHLSERGLRIRLVAVGRARSEDLLAAYSDVTQLIWLEMLAFIWDRLRRYRQQKTQVDQWNAQGRIIKWLADESTRDEFVIKAQRLMGVN